MWIKSGGCVVPTTDGVGGADDGNGVSGLAKWGISYPVLDRIPLMSCSSSPAHHLAKPDLHKKEEKKVSAIRQMTRTHSSSLSLLIAPSELGPACAFRIPCSLDGDPDANHVPLGIGMDCGIDIGRPERGEGGLYACAALVDGVGTRGTVSACGVEGEDKSIPSDIGGAAADANREPDPLLWTCREGPASLLSMMMPLRSDDERMGERVEMCGEAID